MSPRRSAAPIGTRRRWCMAGHRVESVVEHPITPAVKGGVGFALWRRCDPRLTTMPRASAGPRSRRRRGGVPGQGDQIDAVFKSRRIRCWSAPGWGAAEVLLGGARGGPWRTGPPGGRRAAGQRARPCWRGLAPARARAWRRGFQRAGHRPLGDRPRPHHARKQLPAAPAAGSSWGWSSGSRQATAALICRSTPAGLSQFPCQVVAGSLLPGCSGRTQAI